VGANFNLNNKKMNTMQEVRNEVFSCERLKLLVGLDSNCTNQEFIKAIVNLDQEIGFRDKVISMTIKVILNHMEKNEPLPW
jgi:hypothetical protein